MQVSLPSLWSSLQEPPPIRRVGTWQLSQVPCPTTADPAPPLLTLPRGCWSERASSCYGFGKPTMREIGGSWDRE